MHHPTKLMRQHTTRLWATGLVLAACSSLAARCDAASPTPSDIVADSVSGFSGKQGANGWSYGYWDRSVDTDKSYSQTTDFRLLRHFGSDPINRLSGRREFNTGKLWNLKDGLYYTSLWAEGGHPNSTMKFRTYAQAEQWAVRRWVSTTNGPVTISGHAGKVMPWGANWSGGVQARIVVNGKTLFTSAIHDGGKNYSINTTVKIGTPVDFLIGPNPAIGVTKFTATIRTTAALP